MSWTIITTAVNVVLALALTIAIIRTTNQRRSLRSQELRLREQEARVMQVLVDVAKKRLG